MDELVDAGGRAVLHCCCKRRLVTATLNNRQIVVKRYHSKSVFYALKRLFTVSRAKKTWRNAHRIMNAGIPSPLPIACIEKRFGLLRRRSYFVMALLDGDTLINYLNQNPGHSLTDIKAQLDSMLEKLYRARLRHPDIHLDNLLMVGDTVTLIDLDEVRYIPFKPLYDSFYAKDKQFFIESLVKYPALQALYTA